MKQNQLSKLIIYFSILLFFSCEKEQTTESPANGNDAYKPVNVLNEKAGFEHVWDTTRLMQFLGRYGMSDMTIEDNHLLHFVFTERLTGTGVRSYHRNTIDLNTKKTVPLPKDAAQYPDFVNFLNGGETKLVVDNFRPYTNQYIMVLAQYISGFGPRGTRLLVSGDAQYISEVGAYPSNPPLNQTDDAALGYRDLSMGAFPSTIYSFYGAVNNPQPYLITGLRLAYGRYHSIGTYKSDNLGTLKTLFTEVRLPGKNTVFVATKDNQLLVGEYMQIGLPVYQTETPTTLVASIPYTRYEEVINKYEGEYKIERHYSKDGKQMGLFFQHPDTKKYYSFTYNFVSKVIKKVLDGVILEYGDDEKSDVAYDEQGNLYYTGFAGNGSNKLGISIYKVSTAGHSLVGTDNFLKFGEVVHLKYLLGKVYVTVQGTKTGTSVQQLTILRQK